MKCSLVILCFIYAAITLSAADEDEVCMPPEDGGEPTCSGGDVEDLKKSTEEVASDIESMQKLADDIRQKAEHGGGTEDALQIMAGIDIEGLQMATAKQLDNLKAQDELMKKSRKIMYETGFNLPELEGVDLSDLEEEEKKARSYPEKRKIYHRKLDRLYEDLSRQFEGLLTSDIVAPFADTVKEKIEESNRVHEKTKRDYKDYENLRREIKKSVYKQMTGEDIPEEELVEPPYEEFAAEAEEFMRRKNAEIAAAKEKEEKEREEKEKAAKEEKSEL